MSFKLGLSGSAHSTTQLSDHVLPSHASVHRAVANDGYNDLTLNLMSTLRNKHKTETQGLGRDYWLDDSSATKCRACDRTFTTFRRKHHCRICGKIFCSSCTTFIDGDKFNHPGKMRVCLLCLKLADRYQEYASSEDESVGDESNSSTQVSETLSPVRADSESRDTQSLAATADEQFVPRSAPTPPPMMAIPTTRKGEAIEIDIPRSNSVSRQEDADAAQLHGGGGERGRRRRVLDLQLRHGDPAGQPPAVRRLAPRRGVRAVGLAHAAELAVGAVRRRGRAGTAGVHFRALEPAQQPRVQLDVPQSERRHVQARGRGQHDGAQGVPHQQGAAADQLPPAQAPAHESQRDARGQRRELEPAVWAGGVRRVRARVRGVRVHGRLPARGRKPCAAAAHAAADRPPGGAHRGLDTDAHQVSQADFQRARGAGERRELRHLELPQAETDPRLLDRGLGRAGRRRVLQVSAAQDDGRQHPKPAHHAGDVPDRVRAGGRHAVLEPGTAHRAAGRVSGEAGGADRGAAAERGAGREHGERLRAEAAGGRGHHGRVQPQAAAAAQNSAHDQGRRRQLDRQAGHQPGAGPLRQVRGALVRARFGAPDVRVSDRLQPGGRVHGGAARRQQRRAGKGEGVRNADGVRVFQREAGVRADARPVSAGGRLRLPPGGGAAAQHEPGQLPGRGARVRRADPVVVAVGAV
ncbi:hypothetical protein KL944_005307 [Ogataea haglerorum]|nr:hypothetical protein KL944_005307 [Ogataea haglerorum]